MTDNSKDNCQYDPPVIGYFEGEKNIRFLIGSKIMKKKPDEETSYP